MKESDLYPYIKRFLEFQGYEVKAEVQDCDVVAVRGEEPPVIVELKLIFNLQVVLQAIERLSRSSTVYIGISSHCRTLRSRRKEVIKLVRMLGLGLVTIDTEKTSANVAVLIDPAGYKPRISRHRQQRLLGEFVKRVGDPNQGGSDKRRGVMTAYRQRALRIAEYLEVHGPTKAATIAQLLQDSKAREILYRNVYGWFENVARGVYNLSPRGEKEIPSWRAQSDNTPSPGSSDKRGQEINKN